MVIKKTIIAMMLNILFGGLGYFYIKERKALAIFLTFVTVYEFIRNIAVSYDPAAENNPYAFHTLPMLTLFGTVLGVIILVAMTVDIYFLLKRQADKTSPSRTQS